MTSRIPPSRRDPEYAPQRSARAVAQRTPGTGRVAAAAPNLSGDILALLRGKASPAASAAGIGLHVGTSAPADPSATPLWLDTGSTCGSGTAEKLTANQRGLETGATTGWAAVAAPDYTPTIYTTLTAATDQKLSGAYALKAATAAGSVQTSWQTPTGTSGFTVTPGYSYLLGGYVRGNDSGMTVRASLRWYDSGGSLLSTTNSNYLAVPNGSWAVRSWVESGGGGGAMVAPANAAFGSVLFLTSTLGSGIATWMDDLTLTETSTSSSQPLMLWDGSDWRLVACVPPA